MNRAGKSTKPLAIGFPSENDAQRVDRLQRQLERERLARKEAEAIAEKGLRELYESQQQVVLLQHITEGANRLDKFTRALDMAVREICDSGKFDFGIAFQVDESGSSLRASGSSLTGTAAHLRHFAEHILSTSFPAGEHLPGLLLQKPEPHWSHDTELELGEPGASLARAAGIHTCCAFPVMVGKRVVAVIELFARRRVSPTELPSHLLEQIGIQLGYVRERERGRSLLHDTLHDPLTGLGNRVQLADVCERAFNALPPGRRGMAVLVVDLDGFKQVNDRHGHAAGDAMLVHVAQRLRQCLDFWLKQESLQGRPCEGFVARTGGDEFVIMLKSLRESSDIEGLTRHIHGGLGAPLLIGTQLVEPGASIGIALSGSLQNDVDKLQRDADLAMYEAKSHGSGRTVRYSVELGMSVRSRQELENELLNAIRERHFSLWYQPVYRINGEPQLEGYEALLRWNHPEKGLILPDRFIGLAERLGHICQLGAWIIDEACAAAVRLREQAGPAEGYPSISVNIAPQQFLQDDFVPGLYRALERHNLDASAIRLEVTERVAVIDAERTSSVLAGLRESGICTLLDDFGTGYSSLSYLKTLPFDVLKIDRSFVQGLHDNRTSGIVRAIFDLARRLHITVLAEGVETQAQEEMLVALGCSLGQGYLYGRPMLEDEAFALYTSDQILSPPALRRAS